MQKPVRYVIYFFLGVILFFALQREGNEDVLSEIHNHAPVIILSVFALLLLVRSIIEKKNREK